MGWGHSGLMSSKTYLKSDVALCNIDLDKLTSDC